MKTKKVPARAKNINPGRNGEKAMNPRTEKGSPGLALKKDSAIMEHSEIETSLQKARRELAVIKKTAAEASEFTKKALLESEEKFKYFFDNSIIGKSFTLPDGEIHVNKAFCDMLGYSLEELQVRKCQELTHADDMKMTQNEIDLILSGNKNSARFEKKYIHKNGSIVWADVCTSLRRDADGKPVYFVTVVIDISKRKQAESKLNEQIVELQRWHNATLDRESRILDLKREVNELLVKAGHQPRYPSAVARDEKEK